MRKFTKLLVVGGALAALAVPSAASAAGGPSSGPVPNQPGNSCFGNWRAGTVDEFHSVASDWAQGQGFLGADAHMSDYNASGKAACAKA
jgi:hypothetical protein